MRFKCIVLFVLVNLQLLKAIVVVHPQPTKVHLHSFKLHFIGLKILLHSFKLFANPSKIFFHSSKLCGIEWIFSFAKCAIGVVFSFRAFFAFAICAIFASAFALCNTIGAIFPFGICAVVVIETDENPAFSFASIFAIFSIFALAALALFACASFAIFALGIFALGIFSFEMCAIFAFVLRPTIGAIFAFVLRPTIGAIFHINPSHAKWNQMAPLAWGRLGKA